jgi:hypothetical protein
MKQVRREAETRARDALRESGQRERRHAQRAGNLSSRGRNSQTSFPEHMMQDLERAESMMDEAARELQAGRGERALRLQRDAQRLLEQASQGQTTDDSSHGQQPRAGEGTGRHGVQTRGDVPGESGDNARDFRQRVVEGLGSEQSGGLAPAVRRYAEGLLR